MSKGASILLVEDERDVRELMLLHLKRDGLTPETAEDGEEALTKLRARSFDLLILDWMLPGVSGLEIAKQARSGTAGLATDSTIPILMVTAKVEQADIVLGLESGADDYITKPFEVPVFLARVRALIRRANLQAATPAGSTPKRLTIGNLAVDPETYDVRCGNETISLTPSEFKLLFALCQNQGKVLTRNRLISLVQGEGVSVVDRTVDTHVFGLRKKLGDCGELIETIRGVGYRIKESSA